MKLSALRAVVILALAAACNDGSGSSIGDLTAPSVVLTFPPPVSSTDAESITVTGTASDPSGIAEVRVNGVLASTSDGFATWQASVPLAPGMNTLTVATGDLRGNSDTRSAQARIESQALLLWPTAIAVDPSRQLAFVLDGSSIKAVDLTSGARTIVSDHSHGTGPGLSSAYGIALDGDRALVVNRGSPPSVVAVDLASGDRTILSDGTHGVGPRFGYLLAITVDGDRALVTSDGSSAIVAVDLVTGDRAILSGPTVGSGPTFRSPEGIVLDGGRALVLDRMLQALLAVDLATGDRTILSDATTGTGPVFSGYPLAITRDGNRALVSDSGLRAVLAVDLLSGDRTILSDSTGGEPLPAPTAIALDVTDGTRALVTDAGFRAVLCVDLASGECTFVSPPTSVGAGSSFYARGIALEESRALVGGQQGVFLVAVDFATGERTIVSDASTGSGPEFVAVSTLVVDGGRALVLAHHDRPQSPMAIFAVDLASGDRSIVSDSSRGEGPPFDSPQDIALAGSRVLVAERRAVLAVDLASGDRTILSDSYAPKGEGPRFYGLSGIVVDGNRAIVIDNDDCRSFVLEVDLGTGNRTILSGGDTGEGPSWKDLTDLVLDGDRVLVGRHGVGIFAVDLATGDRTVLSDNTAAAGPGFTPEQIAKNGDRIWATAPYLDAVLAVDPRFGQRTIVAR